MKRLLKLLVAITVIAALAYAVLNHVFPRQFLQLLTWAGREQAGLELKHIDVTGKHFEYLDSGSGEPMILLHGFGANKDAWQALAPHLKPRFRLIAPDLPCFGESSRLPAQACRIEDQVRYLSEFTQALQLKRFSLGGNSMGGWIAAAYAARHPQEIAALWLIAPAGVLGAQPSEFFRMVKAGAANPLLIRTPEDLDASFKLVFTTPPNLPAGIRVAMAQDMAARYDYQRLIFDELRKGPDLEPMLGAITAPTLVTWGRQDRILDVSGAPILGHSIRQAQVDIVDAIGHVPMLEAPERIAGVFNQFAAQRMAQP